MENKDKPAFPVRDPKQGTSFYYQGMTKREYFAAMAIQGLLANPTTANSKSNGQQFANDIAITAIGMADELLKQLEATN